MGGVGARTEGWHGRAQRAHGELSLQSTMGLLRTPMPPTLVGGGYFD